MVHPDDAQWYISEYLLRIWGSDFQTKKSCTKLVSSSASIFSRSKIGLDTYMPLSLRKVSISLDFHMRTYDCTVAHFCTDGIDEFVKIFNFQIFVNLIDLFLVKINLKLLKILWKYFIQIIDGQMIDFTFGQVIFVQKPIHKTELT